MLESLFLRRKSVKLYIKVPVFLLQIQTMLALDQSTVSSGHLACINLNLLLDMERKKGFDVIDSARNLEGDWIQ